MKIPERYFSYLRKTSIILFTFDLKSEYHHIEIFSEHQKLLAFTWSLRGVTKLFAFTCLPFGLTSAPYVFIKLMCNFISYCGGLGKRIVVYLDDGIGGGTPPTCCIRF